MPEIPEQFLHEEEKGKKRWIRYRIRYRSGQQEACRRTLWRWSV